MQRISGTKANLGKPFFVERVEHLIFQGIATACVLSKLMIVSLGYIGLRWIKIINGRVKVLKLSKEVNEFSGRKYINLESYNLRGEPKRTPVQSMDYNGLIYV